MRTTPLEGKLGVRFKDRDLLSLAMVHPSYLNEHPPGEHVPGSYERLEFLGDSCLGLAVTMELYRRCPELSEGELTKLRSSIVRGATLAGAARRLGLGEHLRLGRGEESTGGRDRDSNLAAALEALVGAVLLDKGFDTATKLVTGLLAEEMEGSLALGVPEDPKSLLQEVVQARGATSPIYCVAQEGGPDHDKSFDVEVLVEGQAVGRGRGRRKLDAERMAAQDALQSLEPWVETSSPSKDRDT